MKKFRVGIYNPMRHEYFYYETESEYGDILFKHFAVKVEELEG